MKELITYQGDDGLPFQIYKDKVYKLYTGERYYSRGRIRLHRRVWSDKFGFIPRKFDIHHKDQNTHNNNIDNLEIKHTSIHLSEHAKARFKSKPEWVKEFQKKGSEKAKEWHQSEAGRAWHKNRGINGGGGTNGFGVGKCACCKKPFIKKMGIQRFCSISCKYLFYKAENNSEKLK